MSVLAKWFINGLLFTAVFTAQVDAAQLEGRVINSASNQPVANTGLTLTCVKPSKQVRWCNNLTAQTSSEGTFAFERYLTPATYLLTADGAEGLVSTRLSQIQVEVDYRHRVPEILLKLEPEATITGKVVDAEGRPKPDVVVVALRQFASGATTQLTAATKATSDKAGVYVFRRLAPGNYYVVTSITKPNTLVPQNKTEPIDSFLLYAPSTLSLEDAIPTHVEMGKNYADIDLQLRPLTTYRIQGRAQMETSDHIVSGDLNLYLHARDNSGVTAPGREIRLSADGSFQANALPGLYTLRLIGTTTLAQPAGSKTPAPLLVHVLAKQDIEIDGRGVYGIQVLIPPAATITGHIFLEGAGQDTVEKGDVSLKPVEAVGASPCGATETKPDGSFAISHCDAASYGVKFKPPSGTYVKAITFDGQDAVSQPMDLSRCAGGELKIILRPGAASLTATTQAGKLFDVVLIPDSWTANQMIPAIHAVAQAGKYSAAGLAPGHYSAVAALGVDRQFWENAAFIREVRARGTQFDLVEGEQKQLALAELSEEEVNQIALQVGIY